MKRSFKLSGYATTFTEVRRMGIFPGGAARDSRHGREDLWRSCGRTGAPQKYSMMLLPESHSNYIKQGWAGRKSGAASVIRLL